MLFFKTVLVVWFRIYTVIDNSPHSGKNVEDLYLREFTSNLTAGLGNTCGDFLGSLAHSLH